MISCSQYSNISFNGYTIEQINATNGSPQSLQELMGSATDIIIWDGVRSKKFNYLSGYIHFNYKKGYADGWVTRMEVTNALWPVVIQGHTINVGDTEKSLIQKFGSDLKIFTSDFENLRFVAFSCLGNTYDGIDIEINPSTNKISKILYYVLP